MKGLYCLLAALLLAAFAGCDAAAPEPGESAAPTAAPTTPTPTPAAEGTEIPDGDAEPAEAEPPLLTVFTDADAPEYPGENEFIAHPEADPYGLAVPICFVAREEGLTVSYSRLEYDGTVDFLRPVETLWTVYPEPGKAYRFDGQMSETIPQYRLQVDREGELNPTFWNLSEDMADGGTVFAVREQPWKPAPLDGASNLLPLCLAAAAGYAEGMDSFETAALLVSSVHAEMGLDPDPGGQYRAPEWLLAAYWKAMFCQNLWDAEPGAQEWIVYRPELAEYWVTPHPSAAYPAGVPERNELTGGLWAGTWNVKADTPSGPVYLRLAPNAAYDPEDPFGYRILITEGEPMQALPTQWLDSWLDGRWETFLADQRFEDGGIPASLTFAGADSVELRAGGEDLAEAYDGSITGAEFSTADYGERAIVRIEWTLREDLLEAAGSFLPKAYTGTYLFELGVQDDWYMRALEVGGGSLFWSGAQSRYDFHWQEADA
jgi:hypothetical protein